MKKTGLAKAGFVIFSAVAINSLSGATPATQNTPATAKPKQETSKTDEPISAFVAKDYAKLIGLPGFSNKLLNNHFKLYQGYVKNTNALADELKKMGSEGKNNTPAFAELRRRFGWEFNGMRLHELYFDNLGGKETLETADPLHAMLEKNFGSFELWKKDFIATGAMRGIGWVILYHDPVSGRLFNTWINEHDVAHLTGGVPLLVMDVFEHAYMTDYEIDKAAYIEAFMKNIDWSAVKKRAAPPAALPAKV